MKKLFCVVFICLLAISVIGCSEKPVKKNNNESMRTDQRDSDKYSLIDQQSKDVDGDGLADRLRLEAFFNEATNSYKVKLSINDHNKITYFKFPTRFDMVSKMSFSKLPDNRQGIIIKFYDSELGPQHIENPASYNIQAGCRVFGFSHDKIQTLLDTESMPFNRDGNYDIKHLKDFNVEFVDKATNFQARYEIYYDEVMKAEYISSLETINEFQIPHAMSQNRYYNIRTSDTGTAGSSQLILSKFIPGLYHNDVLGIIDYYYDFRNGKYVLTKEVLSHSKVLGLPPIKEMKL